MEPRSVRSIDRCDGSGQGGAARDLLPTYTPHTTTSPFPFSCASSRATMDTAGACLGCRATQQHQHAAAGAALLLSGRRPPLLLSTAPCTPLRSSPPSSHAAATARSLPRQSIRGLSSSGPGEGSNAGSSSGGGGGKTGAGAGAKPSPGAKASQILHQGMRVREL